MIHVDFRLRTTEDDVGAYGTTLSTTAKTQHLCRWDLPQVPANGEVISLPLNMGDRNKPPKPYRVVERSWRINGDLDNDNPNSYSQGILHASVVVVKFDEWGKPLAPHEEKSE